MHEPHIRLASAEDAERLCAFIFEHGPNPWNHLPPAAVTAHLQGITAGAVEAVLAERAGALAGFVSFQTSSDFARYQAAERRDLAHGYICEAVVHRDMAGQGLGSRLLRRAVERLAAQGLADIYIDRHEENAGSAGMMRKAGFVEIDTYADPERRPHGSRRTTVCRLRLAAGVTP